MKMNMGASLNAIVLFISLTTTFFFKVNSSEFTSFSIPKFFPGQQNIILQGSANTTNGKLLLTKPTTFTVGKALYSAPIHIWDNETGNVANFVTSFTVLITEFRPYRVADGFTFFIAPVDTTPQSGGGFLGVFNSDVYNKTIQTVAVEFDTSHNSPWDPWDRTIGAHHIGIDVNSIDSITTQLCRFQSGQEASVVISFNAATNVLNVDLTYPNSLKYTLSGVVPLKDVVPEWVRVGFSAATGADYGAFQILSWSFRSELGGTSSSNQVELGGTSSSNQVAAA